MKKSHYYHTIVCLLMLLNCTFSVIAAEDRNILTKIQLVEQLKNFVMSKLNPDNERSIEIKVMPIDERIFIPECGTAIQFSASEESLQQSNITVKAECPDSAWYMFMIARSTEMQPVVIVSSAVSPGTLLTADNLKVIKMDKKRLRMTTFADIDKVVGARMKRRATSGRPVEASNLCYVCKGDNVTISAGSVAMRVKTSGIALEDGNMGDTIRVRNTRSSKQVNARVAKAGLVEINI